MYKPPRVFISYSHDSDAHALRVFRLANQLRSQGVDARLDQYEPYPREGWPLWMERQIDHADFVLVVCTETYARRMSGEETAGSGLGATWEGNLIRSCLYAERGCYAKFLPVVFAEVDRKFIPRPLQGVQEHRLDPEAGYEAGYTELYCHLTGQYEVKPELGRLRPAPRRSRQWSGPRDVDYWLQEKIAPRYKIEREMGHRNSAVVYKAFDRTLRRDVAIKVFLDKRHQDEFDERVREVVLLSDEPGFITIYDACLEGERHYYVMQFVDGPTLRERTNSYGRQLPVSTIRKIVLGIGEALVQAHGKHFIHAYCRLVNIKPSNILLTKDDQPFISPLHLFGGCSGRLLLEELKHRAPRLGEQARSEEVAYLLPEQFEEQTDAVCPEHSVQYMLGLLAYELASGEIPPTLDSLKDLEDKGTRAFRRLPPITDKRSNVPERIQQILLKMTSLLPTDRYMKLEDAIDAIRSVVPSISVAEDSLKRCTRTPEIAADFFKTFYDEFMRLCPDARERFRRFEADNWQRQYLMLNDAIRSLLDFCKREEPHLLSRIAVQHGRTQYDISPRFYEPFVDALVHTVCGYPPHVSESLDPHCTDNEGQTKSIERAWRNALKPGIDYMKSKY